jgi:hypothetical protein
METDGEERNPCGGRVRHCLVGLGSVSGPLTSFSSNLLT